MRLYITTEDTKDQRLYLTSPVFLLFSPIKEEAFNFGHEWYANYTIARNKEIAFSVEYEQ